MLVIIFQSPIKFFALSVRKRNGCGHRGNAVPNIFYKLNALGNAELKDVSH